MRCYDKLGIRLAILLSKKKDSNQTYITSDKRELSIESHD